MPEEKDFEFVDRRKKDEEEKVDEKEVKKDDEKRLDSAYEQNIYDLLKFFISTLVANAWFFMGLIAHPETKEIKKDLKQAKVAIDVISLLFEKMQDNLQELEKKEIRAVIADLQINYINQSKIL